MTEAFLIRPPPPFCGSHPAPLPAQQPVSFPAGLRSQSALCPPRPHLAPLNQDLAPPFPGMTHFLLSGPGHLGPLTGKAVATLLPQQVTCLLLPPPVESSLRTGGPCLIHPSPQGSAQCQAQRSHSTNACSSSDLTQLARQLTEEQMSVFLLLCDYSQDNIVPATDFHTGLRFVAIDPTHLHGGWGVLPGVNVFCGFLTDSERVSLLRAKRSFSPPNRTSKGKGR